jgi:hypothetical protein
METTVDVNAILADLAAATAMQEATQRYKGYTVADLRTVFEALHTPQDWKGPIAVTMTGDSVLTATAAIEFFTGTTPTVTLNIATMRYLVEADGYRRGPAGDH